MNNKRPVRWPVWIGCLALLGLAVPVLTAAPVNLVVVHQGGRVTTMPVAPGTHGGMAKAGDAACEDESVAFAFTEEAIPGGLVTIERSRGSDEVGIRASLVCSALFDTQVRLVYEVQARSGMPGYIVNPQASVDLGAPGSSAVASFRVDILDGAPHADEHFSIRRGNGQFSGSLNGVALFGKIPAGASALLEARITGSRMPEDAPEGLGGRVEDPWLPDLYHDLYQHCTQAANRDQAECRSVADLVAAGDINQFVQVLRAVSPEKATAMAPSAAQLIHGQVGNVALRVAHLLQGTGGGFSTSGLTLAGGGMMLPIGDLAGVLNASGERNEEKRTLLGGTRWGFWLNGTIGGGDWDRHKGNAGFDFDNWALSTGLDYRVTDAFFLGAAAGYSRFTSKFDEVDDRLEADSHALHLYGGYSLPNGLSLDGSVSWMRTDFDLYRYLPGPGSADVTRLDHLTRGSPDATQHSASLGASWYVQRDAWTLAPSLQYQWMKSRIDAFTEGGSSLFRLAYERQDIVTRSLSAGLYGDVALATEVGTFRPWGRLLWYHDSGTGAHNLLANFVEGGTPINSVVMVEPDRSYATLEAGLAFRRPIGTRTVDFNFGVMKLLGFEALDRWALRADVRIPF